MLTPGLPQHLSEGQAEEGRQPARWQGALRSRRGHGGEVGEGVGAVLCQTQPGPWRGGRRHREQRVEHLRLKPGTENRAEGCAPPRHFVHLSVPPWMATMQRTNQALMPLASSWV